MWQSWSCFSMTASSRAASASPLTTVWWDIMWVLSGCCWITMLTRCGSRAEAETRAGRQSSSLWPGNKRPQNLWVTYLIHKTCYRHTIPFLNKYNTCNNNYPYTVYLFLESTSLRHNGITECLSDYLWSSAWHRCWRRDRAGQCCADLRALSRGCQPSLLTISTSDQLFENLL